ncbi:MAG TPA: DUF1700 domain-containing protein [Rhizomicrobium sp.]|nr:DUF1700 domain-containing protein [Rhizomicrobium sp.]
MNRAHFMAQLRDGLAGLHHSDIDDIVADYESHFADGAADGRSQEEVAAALGDPVRLARELRAEIGFRRWEENRSAGNFLGVVLALLGLATIDFIILLPFLCFLAALFFGLAVACLAGVVGGSALLFNLLPFGWGSWMGHPAMQLLIGLGLISGAIGGGALLLLLMDIIAKLLIRYARLHFRLFDTANKSI